MTKTIREIHAESRGSYGSPHVHAELTLGKGERINRNASCSSCAWLHTGRLPAQGPPQPGRSGHRGGPGAAPVRRRRSR
ncbi:IS3 family transposase [Acrocarpospora pleiomorpha]|uniref:IS3 family transposase n=1 Tax=Acrocarpospora pleiomorpha TaxID=90975 RepID=UPI003CD07653